MVETFIEKSSKILLMSYMLTQREHSKINSLFLLLNKTHSKIT